MFWVSLNNRAKSAVAWDRLKESGESGDPEMQQLYDEGRTEHSWPYRTLAMFVPGFPS